MHIRTTFTVTVSEIKTRKLSYRKDDRAMRPIYGCTENFLESLTRPTAIFPKFLMGSVPMDPVNIPAKSEVRSFTNSRDNSDWSFGWGLRTSNLGKGGVGGREWYRSKELW